MPKPLATVGNAWKLVSLGFMAAALGCTQPMLTAGMADIPLPPGVSPDAATFRNQLASLGFGSGYTARTTHDRLRPSNCKNCFVLVHIDVLADTRQVDPNSAIANAVPIAHLVNMDDKDSEAYFSLRPGKLAEYYVWVDNDAARKPRYTLLELTGTAVKATAQWYPKHCHNRQDGEAPGPSDFDFYEFHHGVKPCDAAASSANPGASFASFSPAVPFSQFFTHIAAILGRRMAALPGNWIECNSGCCT